MEEGLCCLQKDGDDDDEEEEFCQLQMMADLFILFMKKLGLEKVIGFLVSKNAARFPTNTVYEENNTFHINMFAQYGCYQYAWVHHCLHLSANLAIGGG